MSDSKEKNLDYEVGGVSVFEVHDSVRREKELPTMGREPVGMSAVILGAIVLVVGSGYFWANFGGFNNDSIYTIGEYYQPLDRPATEGGGVEEDDSPWIDKWMKSGKKVYGNCGACHGGTGAGAPGQFPPLAGSEWVDGGTERLGAILLNGINGNLSVAGKSYNQQMPAWNLLDDEKLAQVVTYIRREFGTMPEGEDGVVTTEMMKAAREKYGSHGVWDEAGLLAIPEDAMLPGAKVDLLTGEPIAGE